MGKGEEQQGYGMKHCDAWSVVVEKNLWLKCSILDCLDHVVGQVEDEQSLIELEPIVDCTNLKNMLLRVFCPRGCLLIVPMFVYVNLCLSSALQAHKKWWLHIL